MRLDPISVLRHRARRAHLDHSAADPGAVVRALVALHATDPATVHLSVWARLPPRPIADVTAAMRRALEEERSLVRLLGMRRTLHVVERSLAPAVLTLAAERLAGPQRRRLDPLLVKARVAPKTKVNEAYERVVADILGALDGGDLDTDALGERVPVLQKRVQMAEDKAYGAEMPLSRFVLEAVSNRGHIVRARAVGGWRNSRCTWARTDRWLPGLASPPPPAEAYRTLVRAWLLAFGPAPLDDAAWWTGLPKRDVAAALKALGREVIEVEVEGWPGSRWMLADDPVVPSKEELPPAFLPGLDPSIMAVQDRRSFLDPAMVGPLFDRSGNAAPTIWIDGKVAGGWACRKDGEVVFRLLDPAAARRHRAAVEAEARRLQDALGGEVVQPRFPTPLTRELAGP